MINIQDIIVVINFILYGQFEILADVNYDNAVDVLDIIQLKLFLIIVQSIKNDSIVVGI